jgi:hypothetical protein
MRLLEFITASTSHFYENGLYTDSVNKEDNYINLIGIECDDCGLSKEYSRKRLPKWVQKRLNQVAERPLKGE